MGRPGKLFIDWCLDEEHKEQKHVLDCFIGDTDDLKPYESVKQYNDIDYIIIDVHNLKTWEEKENNITDKLANITTSSDKSFWFKCENCGVIYKKKIKEVKSCIEKGETLHCADNNKDTLYNFLHNGKNDDIELIGLVYNNARTGLKNRIIAINGKGISVTSDKKILLRRTTFNQVQEKSISDVCTQRVGTVKQMRENGLAKVENCSYVFTLQDWCLLFYSYIFDLSSGLNYSGKYVMFKLSGNSKISLSKDLNILGNNEKCKFKCSNNDIQKWESMLRKVAYGETKWCNNTSCSTNGCVREKEREKWSKYYSSLEEFIKEYYDHNRKVVESALNNLEKNKITKIETIAKTLDTKRLNENILLMLKNQKLLQDYVLRLLQGRDDENKDILIYIKKRKRIIDIILDIDGDTKINNTKMEKIRKEYDEAEKKKVEMIRQWHERAQSLDQHLVMLLRDSWDKYYDYIIELDNFTIKKAKNGILYGRPTHFKDEEFEKYEDITYNWVAFKIIRKNELDSVLDKERYKDELKANRHEKLSPIFNGLLPESIDNVRFGDIFRIPKFITELTLDSIKNCTFDSLMFHPTVLEDFTKIYNNNNNNTFSRNPTIIRIGKFNIKNKKIEKNYIQYNDVFKMGEALRVYEDHLTLYRGEVGQGLQEYEYMNNFEYHKFYMNSDEMIITIHLAQLNIVSVSEVTDALIDIYNEMNN